MSRSDETGDGGGSIVGYRARDERLDRDATLKVLPAAMFADETAPGRFRRESLPLFLLKKAILLRTRIANALQQVREHDVIHRGKRLP